MSIEIIEKGKKVKIRFNKKIYKKHPFYVPIIKDGEGVFLTGQDLTYNKQVGKEVLTKEEREKYPFVIDPTDFPKIYEGQTLNTDLYYDRAILNLALISGKIATSKSEHEKNKVKYVGYVEDELAESKFYNEVADMKYEAETLIRSLPISEYGKIALIVNYTMGKSINVDSMPEDYIKSKLLEAVNENPKEVLNCFPKHNPGIEQDMYILELLKYKILQKRSGNDIYDGDTFIGSSLSQAKNYMTLKAHAGEVDKWKFALDKAKGKVSDDKVESLSSSNVRGKEYKDIVDKIKVSIVDDELGLAVFHFDRLTKEFEDLLDTTTKDVLLAKINELKNKKKGVKDSDKKEQFMNKLDESTLEELQRKIKHVNSPYKEEDCREVWEDKEGLIKYMTQVKFPE